MARLYRASAMLALAEFGCLASAHVAALVGFIAPPVAYAFAIFPLLFFGQLVAIAGLNGGSLLRSVRFIGVGRQLRLGAVGLRYIPTGWKIFGIPFWYGYMPVTFFWRMVRSGVVVEDAGGSYVLREHGHVVRVLTADQAFSSRADQFIGVTAILMGFAFAHFVLLRFIVPNRQEILDEVSGDRVGAPNSCN